MVRFARIIAVIGLIIQGFGLLMVGPMSVAVLYAEWSAAASFLGTLIVGVVCGRLAHRIHAGAKLEDLNRLEGMGVVAFGWLAAVTVGAIPYCCGGLSVIDSMFESMSGLTTTGATVFTDFSRFSASLFFYRGLAQWLGGVGILVLFVAILPHLAVAGRQLFFAETSTASKEKLTPHIRDTARQIWGWYFFLTVILALLLLMTGMNPHDAVANSFTTMAAGGHSPHQKSIMGYQNPTAEWIIICFMFLAGANFTLQVKSVLRRDLRILFRDGELRAYVAIVVLASVLLFVILATSSAYGWSIAALRASLFQNLSIITTTGFVTDDFDQWSNAAKAVLIVMMFIGGCSGSAGGGIKVVRFMFLVSFVRKGLRQTIHPHAILPIRVGHRFFADTEIQPIVAFIITYFFLFAVGGVVVSIIENDLTVGLSGAIATLGNIGLGFGLIGPTGSFAPLHPVSKAIFIFFMWAGRLELMTLLVFCKPEIWRRACWT